MWYYNIFVFQNLREHCVKVYTRYHFRNLPSNSLVSRLLYLSYYSCRIVVCLLHFWMRKNQQFITIIKIYGSMLLRWMRWLISHKRVDNLNFENLWNKLLIQNYFFLITSTMYVTKKFNGSENVGSPYQYNIFESEFFVSLSNS